MMEAFQVLLKNKVTYIFLSANDMTKHILTATLFLQVHKYKYMINTVEKSLVVNDHKILLIKLDNYGIRGVANNLLIIYLFDRQQYTSILDENLCLSQLDMLYHNDLFLVLCFS